MAAKISTPTGRTVIVLLSVLLIGVVIGLVSGKHNYWNRDVCFICDGHTMGTDSIHEVCAVAHYMEDPEDHTRQSVRTIDENGNPDI